MKYMTCVDKFVDGRLVGKSMRLIGVPDPSILIDAIMYMIAADEKMSRKKLATFTMPLSWTHNNVKNNKDRGCVKIKDILESKDHYWVLYYKQIRDHEVIRIKEEDYDKS